MYTTCPDCSSVYEITPEEIAIASGLVRCGNCDATFSAVRRLSATPPADIASADATSDAVAPNQSSLDFDNNLNEDDAASETPEQVSVNEAPANHQYVDLDGGEFMEEAGDNFDELTEFAAQPVEFFDADVFYEELDGDAPGNKENTPDEKPDSNDLDNDERTFGETPDSDDLENEKHTPDEKPDSDDLDNDERTSDEKPDSDDLDNDERTSDETPDSDDLDIDERTSGETPDSDDRTSGETPDSDDLENDDRTSDEKPDSDAVVSEEQTPDEDSLAQTPKIDPEADEERSESPQDDSAKRTQAEQTPNDVLEQWNTEDGEHDLEALLADDDFMSDDFTEDEPIDAADIDENESKTAADEFSDSNQSTEEHPAPKVDDNEAIEVADAKEDHSVTENDHDIEHAIGAELTDDSESDNDTTADHAPDHQEPEEKSDESEYVENDKNEIEVRDKGLTDSDTEGDQAQDSDEPAAGLDDSDTDGNEIEAPGDDDHEQSQADQDEEKDVDELEPEEHDDQESDSAKDESNQDDSEAADDNGEADAQADDENKNLESDLPAEETESTLSSAGTNQTDEESSSTGDQHEAEQEQQVDDLSLDSKDILVEDVDGQFDSEVNDKHDYKDISQYLTPAKSLGRRITESVLAVLLVAGLAAQYIHHERAKLATDPRFGDVVQDAYQKLGLELQPDWSVADYRIARHTIVPHPLDSQVLLARATIINNSSHARPMPLLRLEIKNRWGDVVFTRIFTANEYLAKSSAIEISGNDRVEAAVDFINPTEETEIGYSFDVCLSIGAGAVDCGEKAIFSQQ